MSGDDREELAALTYLMTHGETENGCTLTEATIIARIPHREESELLVARVRLRGPTGRHSQRVTLVSTREGHKAHSVHVRQNQFRPLLAAMIKIHRDSEAAKQPSEAV